MEGCSLLVTASVGVLHLEAVWQQAFDVEREVSLLYRDQFELQRPLCDARIGVAHHGNEHVEQEDVTDYDKQDEDKGREPRIRSRGD